MSKTLNTFLMLTALVGSRSVVEAAVINIDINDGRGTYSGIGAAPDAGTHWNLYTTPPGADPPPSGLLLDSQGNSNGTAVFDVVGSGVTTSYIEVTGSLVPLLCDYSSRYNSPHTFRISGLVPGYPYDLYLYANKSGGGSRFTIAGTTRSTDTTENHNTFVLNDNYVRYTGIAADVSGIISGSWTYVPGDASKTSAYNGLQIVGDFVIPEPGGGAILAVALLGEALTSRMTGRRRQRGARRATSRR